MRRIGVSLAALSFVTACSGDPTSSSALSPLHFLVLAPGAPAYANAADSFWAVKGQDRRLSVYFRPPAGVPDSSRLLELFVPAQSLALRPDGSTIADGDSVFIHVTIIDPAHMIVAFAPSGLQFSAANPAQLRLDFGEANQDINEDGDVDAIDDSLKTMIHIYRQEATGQPWIQLPGVVDVTAEEVEAEISGFSNYALAY
jgi:hypothetical protein